MVTEVDVSDEKSVALMNRTLGELTESVKGLRRDTDRVLLFIETHGALLDDHEKRVTRLEDTATRSGEMNKTVLSFALGVITAVIAAWLKMQLKI
jgi:uncharacterized protein YoxC